MPPCFLSVWTLGSAGMASPRGEARDGEQGNPAWGRGDGARGLGFKVLTEENWTQPDPVNCHFARLSARVGPVQMTGEDWAQALLSVNLSDAVPVEIRDLFSVARGAMVYGWFFYPMFRLGEEQLFRVVETAAKVRCRDFADCGKPRSFNEAITQLARHGVIPVEDTARWAAVRHLRNMASHPERASVVPPGMAVGTLHGTARDIDSLFPVR